MYTLYQGFTQIIWLSLGVNQIKDVTPLQLLTELEPRFFDNNEISKLPSSLSSLTLKP